MKTVVNEATEEKQAPPLPQSEGGHDFYKSLHWHLYFGLTFPDLAIRHYHFAIEPALPYFGVIN